jgi:hypothetical protein
MTLIGVLNARTPQSYIYPDVPGPFIALKFDPPIPLDVRQYQPQWQQIPRRSCWDIAKEVGNA